MKTNIGLWIDQRKAVILLGTGEGATLETLYSHADKQPGRTDGHRSAAPFEPQLVQADDVRQRKFSVEMKQYHEEIQSMVGEARRLLIFGPGEAGKHLCTHLTSTLPSHCVIEVETADKMTDRQISEHVREHFKKAAPIILSN